MGPASWRSQWFVAGWLEAAGVEVRVDEVAPGRANVIGIARGTGDGRGLLLNGHTDMAMTATTTSSRRWRAIVDAGGFDGAWPPPCGPLRRRRASSSRATS